MDSFNLFLTIWQFIVVTTLLLLIFSLYDILNNKFNKNNKLIWILVVLFVPLFGALFYIFMGRKQRITA